MLDGFEKILRGKTIKNVSAETHRLKVEFSDGSKCIIKSEKWDDADYGVGLFVFEDNSLFLHVAPIRFSVFDGGFRDQ